MIGLHRDPTKLYQRNDLLTDKTIGFINETSHAKLKINLTEDQASSLSRVSEVYENDLSRGYLNVLGSSSSEGEEDVILKNIQQFRIKSPYLTPKIISTEPIFKNFKAAGPKYSIECDLEYEMVSRNTTFNENNFSPINIPSSQNSSISDMSMSINDYVFYIQP